MASTNDQVVVVGEESDPCHFDPRSPNIGATCSRHENGIGLRQSTSNQILGGGQTGKKLAKISAEAMHSAKVMQIIYQVESFVVQSFSFLRIPGYKGH